MAEQHPSAAGIRGGSDRAGARDGPEAWMGRLRNRADLRTLAFMAVVTGLLVVQWSLESLSPFLYAFSLLMIITVPVMAHNHSHVKTWTSKTLNVLTDLWLTVFYGFPIFAWSPTHIANHHHFNNRAGDYTITYRYTERNHLGTVLTYPSVSSRFQQGPVWRFFANARAVPRRFLLYVAQVVALVAFIVVALLLDWRKGLLYVVVPQQVALFTVLVFNYLQHVHCDEESRWNHSRNFVGPVLNFVLLNNGFHTIHHEKAALHWSQAPAGHAKIADKIDPVLNERSLFVYLARTYFLAPFFPSLRRPSLRLLRIARETSAGSAGSTTAARVERQDEVLVPSGPAT
jgi:beta-carotene hydroxylase